MSSKSKSGLSDTPNSKITPATPRISKVSRGVTKSESDTPSPLPKSRVSIERSPRTVTSKPTADRRSPKVTDSAEVTSKPTVDRRSSKVTDSAEVTSKLTVDRRSPKVTDSAERPSSRLLKVSDLQAQLNLAQEELKIAKEQIALIGKDKAKAINELNEAQKSADEANEKLREALVAQKRAEESSEIEKFRAIELEQSGIEAVQKKEEEWMKVNEAVRNQHAVDVSALLTTTQELQKLQQDIAMALEAKQQALTHADDVTKIAEIHVEKVQGLNEELARVKKMLDSKLQIEDSETNRMILDLRDEVEKAKAFESAIENLNAELEAAKMAESYAYSLVEEWKNRVEELEEHLEESNKQERSALESLNSVLQQLEQKSDLLHDARSESSALIEKIGLLEMTVATEKSNLHDSEQKLRVIEEENAELEKTIESLKLELENTNKEKKASSSSLLLFYEEKKKLMNDLKTAKEEEEKKQKAIESLASALHEASGEARESKEKLLYLQIEHETCETQLEDLQLVLKVTNEKYETMVNDARHEIDLLTDELEQSKTEWKHKEHELMDCVKQSEAENSFLQKEKDRLVNLLRHVEKEAQAAMVEESLQRDHVSKVEADIVELHESLGEAKTESIKLKETLLDKENELQSFAQENQEIQAREAAALQKIEDLSKLLEEAKTHICQTLVEDGEEEDKNIVDDLKKEESTEEESDNGFYDEAAQIAMAKMGTATANGKKEEEDDSMEEEYKMWESCKIEKKEFLPEHESAEEEVESMADSVDQVNGGNPTIAESVEDGGNSPLKQESSSQKKKKPLLHKFGSLLKKKGSSTVKS